MIEIYLTILDEGTSNRNKYLKKRGLILNILILDWWHNWLCVRIGVEYGIELLKYGIDLLMAKLKDMKIGILTTDGCRKEL